MCVCTNVHLERGRGRARRGRVEVEGWGDKLYCLVRCRANFIERIRVKEGGREIGEREPWTCKVTLLL